MCVCVWVGGYECLCQRYVEREEGHSSFHFLTHTLTTQGRGEGTRQRERQTERDREQETETLRESSLSCKLLSSRCPGDQQT